MRGHRHVIGKAPVGVRGSVAAAVVIGAFVLAGCGAARTTGSAVPEPGSVTTGVSGTGAGSPSTTVSAPEKGDTLADMDPCDLLTTADKAALQITESEKAEKVGTEHVCVHLTAEGSVSPGIRTNVGLAGVVVNGPISDLSIGSHQARQMRTTTGGCFVFLGVTASSRVDVLAGDLRGNQDAACELALRAAELIEPNLPES
ncbi:DUF3558 domain-containing protein [Actinokineospora sp. PR83]|uniref:DUF3558 family protein n=1 Tax=Actinokineospora sp. PR83 TaxID=2884908 RepID=UPI001F16EFC0|nr:DUF3558 family protein [Actinokineospora sp. PR83]MCG8920520.1 DUF3558 domain-containing protein [Actinokineospora sp. PR83]